MENESSSNTLSKIIIQPIGYVRSFMSNKFTAPHQPDPVEERVSVVELLTDPKLTLGLRDLDTFSHIWLIWQFHLNKNWRSTVLPPRGPAKRRGVFATRSPYRPNPIGLTAVPVVRIEGSQIFIGAHDLVDGTPILDIKPYLPKNDAIFGANGGWVDEIEKDLALQKKYELRISKLALQQLAWLAERKIDFMPRAKSILEVDPHPHRTRRIVKLEENLFRMACASWRIFYSINDNCVEIKEVRSGYTLDALLTKTERDVPDYQAHCDYCSGAVVYASV